MFSDEELEEIVDYLAEVDGDVFIGCDSKRFVKREGGKEVAYAVYVLVVVVHKNNANGCRIFHTKVTERLYENNPKNISYRLMLEIYKIAELYRQIAPFIDENRNLEVHLDLNSSETHKSHVVVKEAIGYIRGLTGKEPKIKPEAFAATAAADHII